MNNLLSRIVFFFLFITPALLMAQPSKKTGEFYQITVYQFSTAAQQKQIEQYVQEAYLPALHRQQIKNIGVFTPIANDTATGKRLYVLVPVRSLQQVQELTAKLANDKAYMASGKSYFDAAYKNPPYNRMENILLQAFHLAPFLKLPKLKSPASERVYELRSYESATEKIFKNKVQMFNEGGEITLFEQLNFNAIFYASVIAGSRMPNLMYMTSFENISDREAHWKSFVDAPVWKKLSALPEYQNNVSKIEIILMHATAYSDY